VTETSWFWVGVVGMALGAVLLTVLGKKRTQDEEAHTVIHGLVPLIAAIAYFSMAIGQGGVTLSDGRVFWYARYIDWSITTPLLLLGLCITALHGAHRRRALVAAVLGADVLMIVTGLFSGLSTEAFPRWSWFLISCGAFVALYVALFGPLLEESRARDDIRRHSYLTSAVALGGLWLLYPVVVLLGPDGVGVWSPTTTTGCITVVDLLSKLAYGVLVVRASQHDADGDLKRGEVAPTLVTSHGVPSDAGAGPPQP
jgi:bacteriorhodopsin